MTARVIGFHGSIPMMGFDHHNGLYYVNIFNGLSPGPPLPPAPIPPGMGIALESFHYVNITSDGGLGGVMLKESKNNPDVLANDRDSIISRNHDCRSWHVPPGGNVLVAFTILFSSSKFFLGVESVRASAGAVAATSAGPIGQNLNCGDPISHFLTNMTVSPGTVEVSPTAEDYALAGAEWAAAAAVELAASWGFGKLANSVKPYVNRIPWPKWAVLGPNKDAMDKAAKAASDAVDDVIKREGRDAVAQEVLEKEGHAASKAAKELIDQGKDGAFEAEKKAAKDAAKKEAERLIIEEGKAPEEAAREAASKAARDHFEKKMKPTPGRLDAGTEKAISENADEAGQKAADAYKPVRGEPTDRAPQDTIPGAGVDAAGDPAKQQAGDWTEAEQKWAVDEMKDGPSGSDE